MIQIKDLSKKYVLPDNSEFWALKNISFNLKKGEVLGIIGHNGAGKTSILNIISGVSKPSSGTIEIFGSLTSILDIGTGFHPDMTGKENVYLSGRLSGLNKLEIDEVFNDLVEFSELKEFINYPVKTYSNGMYMRLAFSVFAFLKPQILLLDEVFSVGDVAFQSKCLDKIENLINQGVSIIIVTHSTKDIEKICNRVLILKQGQVFAFGPMMEMLNLYLEETFLNTIGSKTPICCYKTFTNGEASNDFFKLNKASIQALNKEVGEPILREDNICLSLSYSQLKEVSIQIIISIKNSKGDVVILDSEAIRENYHPKIQEIGDYQISVIIPQNLLNRDFFFLNIIVCKNFDQTKLGTEFRNVLTFKVDFSDWELKNLFSRQINAVIRPQLSWVSERIN